jgi:hypothetical protein
MAAVKTRSQRLARSRDRQLDSLTNTPSAAVPRPTSKPAWRQPIPSGSADLQRDLDPTVRGRTVIPDVNKRPVIAFYAATQPGSYSGSTQPNRYYLS